MSNEKPLILVVDDEPDIRELIKDILEDEAYRVITASNGEEARLYPETASTGLAGYLDARC